MDIGSSAGIYGAYQQGRPNGICGLASNGGVRLVGQGNGTIGGITASGTTTGRVQSVS